MKKGAGVAGSAVLVGTAGLYLIYIGFKDVPFVDGLRSLLRKENPAPGSKTPWTPSAKLGSGITNAGDLGSGTVVPMWLAPTPSNTLGLVGNALRGYAQFRATYPNMTMLGRGPRPETPSSDHPIGKAIDLMTTSDQTAQQIIRIFRSQPGAKYWIWNRRKGSLLKLWMTETYTGSNPHIDHVHLSYF